MRPGAARRGRRVKGDTAGGVGADAETAGHPRRRREDAGIPQERVTINVTLLGGGFGRKSKWDFEIEAAYSPSRWASR